MGRRAGRRSARVCIAMIAFLILPALGVFALADLQIANLTLTPEIVEQGETTFIRASVSSTGIGAGDAVIIRIALRRVDLQEECCYIERALTFQQVRSGYLIEEPIDTSTREPGTYAITVSVDPAGLVEEENETNNQAILFLQVLALKPELHPQQLLSEPASPVDRGQAVVIATEIENSGHREAGGFSVVFSLFPAFSVSSGSSVPTLQFAPAASEGNLDSTTVDDTSELDFETWFEQVGQSLEPDTWIPFWSANVSGLDLDDDIEIASVLPTGQGLRDLLVPKYLTAEEMALLQDGTTVYAIRVAVDPASSEGDVAGSVAEEDESNNTLFGALSVRPSTLALPELHFTSLFLDGPLPLEWGDRQDVNIIVTNTGGSPAPFGDTSSLPDVDVEVQYRRAGVGSNEWQSLGVETVATTNDPLGIEEGNNTVDNDNLEVSVTGIPLEPGEYELKAIVDPEGLIAEQNEDNNELVIGFSVEGGELHPTGILVASDELRQGGAFSLSVPIRNTGKLTLTSFVVGFFLDDVRFDTFYYYESLGGNGDGGVEEDETAWAQGVLDTEGVPPGEYELRVVVDPDNVIPEMDEANNEISRTVRILSREARKPELVPVLVTLEPNSPLVELTDTIVRVEILNRGTLDASGFIVALESQAESAGVWTRVADAEDGAEGVLVPALARGGRTIVMFVLPSTSIAAVGPYRLRAVVDILDQIEELDEENNTLSVGLWVGPRDAETVPPSPYANLVFKSLVVAPTQNLDAREEISVQEAIVWNAGQEAAGAFDVSLCWRDARGSCVSMSSPIRISGLDAETEIELSTQLPSMEAPAIPGSYQIVGIVDAANEIDEHGREQDNTALAHVQVTGMVKPDLTIDEVWFESEPPFEVGADVTVFARVRNRSGDVGAGAFDVRFEQTEGGPVRDFGVARLGPKGTLDLSFDLSTSSIGDFVLRVTADVDDAVTESDDDDASSNNTLEALFSVVAITPASVVEATSIGGSVRYLAVDSSADTLYASSSSGRVVAIRHADSTDVVFDVSLDGGAIVDLVFVPGVSLYVGTESGSIYALNPSTGGEEDEIILPDGLSVTCMKAGEDGRLYVGTSDGVMAIDATGTLTSGDVPQEAVLGLAIDPSDGFVNAATESSVYTLDRQLDLQCVVGGLPGTLSSLAAGAGAIYVGTEEGVLFAYARCGDGTSWMWRYPRDGSLGSPINAVVVDRSDFDPIYVATGDGRLTALDALGEEMWSHTATAALATEPVWDGRTGRVFFVDEGGTPYVLNTSGTEAVTIDSALSAGVSVSSSLIIDEYVAGLGSDARLVRVYYYGGDDGTVYMIQTER